MNDYKELADQFREQGFLIVEDFFDAAKVDEIESAVRRYIDRIEAKEIVGEVVYEPGTERKIRNLFDMDRDDEYFAKLAQAPELTQLATAIFDDRPVSISVELFGKPARVGSEVPHHQDNAYFNLVPDQALTIWVALTDATEENGCVRYLQGSHKFGNLPHEASGVKGNSQRLGELPPGAGPEICGIVRRGGALIHHCNTIHRSDPNRSNRDRPGLLFVYKAARCQIDQSLAKNYGAVLAATT